MAMQKQYICDGCGEPFSQDEGHHLTFSGWGHMAANKQLETHTDFLDLCPRCYGVHFQKIQSTLHWFKSFKRKGDVLL